MRAIFLFLAAFGTAAGQIDLTDLATTGDGGIAYFTSTLPLKDEPAQPATVPGRIFRIGPQGFELYLQRTRIDPPVPPGMGQIGFSNYFNLFRPEASRDGSIVAVTGQRICSGSSRCASETTLQTTVTGLPAGTIDVTGAGRLSGNGRYLLIYFDGSVQGNCAYVVDLEAAPAPPPQPCPVSAGFGATGAGRAVADDGTAVTASGSIYFIQGPKVTQVRVPLGSPGEAVIDSAASVVVYSLFDWGTNRRSIRLYRIAEQRDTELAAFPGADSHAPYIAADGQRVMFLSDASGLPQIYTVPTAGGEPRQATSDSTGVLSAAMSDDGKIAWYFSGAGRLYTVNLDTRETTERIGRTPQIGYVARMTAGSLYSLPGAGFSDATYIASYPLPRSLGGISVNVNGVDAPLVSVSPTGILLQAPSQTQAETYAQVNTDSSSPFIPKAQFATTTYTALGLFLKNQQSPSAYGGPDALAIHDDWSALITSVNPARPNEIVHLYGTGFGPVDAQPPDGLPAPADPPARTITPVTCWSWGADNATKLDIPVLYSGLAPGLAGIYQLDVRLPASNLRSYGVQLVCTGEGDSTNFYGSFAVKP